MPVKTIAWACKFKCGYKVQTHKQRMIDHEGRCSLNLERRTCRTCKYDLSIDWKFYCGIDKKPNGEKLVYDCEFWELKTNDCKSCKHRHEEYDNEYMGHQLGEAVFSELYLCGYSCKIDKRSDEDENLVVNNCNHWESRQ